MSGGNFKKLPDDTKLSRMLNPKQTVKSSKKFCPNSENGQQYSQWFNVMLESKKT